MSQVSVINTITVPKEMDEIAKQVRNEYVSYFSKQDGFVSSTFYQSINTDDDGSLKYVNIVVWRSKYHFDQVVNLGFSNAKGENRDGKMVLGKGFPEPIQVSPGQYIVIGETNT